MGQRVFSEYIKICKGKIDVGMYVNSTLVNGLSVRKADYAIVFGRFQGWYYEVHVLQANNIKG